jgi:anti-sigma regulatory factor (Ser/Thr protein kinase)
MPSEISVASETSRSWPPVRGALLQLAPHPTAPRLARRSVRDILDWAPSEATDRIELLVSELLTNSVIHAGLDSDQTVDVRLTCGGDRVRLDVADPGHWFRAVAVEPKPGALGQWGFYLVSTLSDRWGVKELDHGKAVWFEIDL